MKWLFTFFMVVFLYVKLLIAQTIITHPHQINGLTLPYTFYYHVNTNQTISVNIITTCVHIHHRIKDSDGTDVCGKGDQFLENNVFSCSLFNNETYYFYTYVYEERFSTCNWMVRWNEKIECRRGCAYCPDENLCTSCLNGFYLFNGLCYLNYPYCQYMDLTNVSKCGNCTAGYTRTPNGTCKSCTGLVRFCKTCTGLLCSICQQKYYLKSIGNSCKRCNDSIPGCVTCTNNVTCTLCQQIYHLPATGICVKCSDVIPNCKFCSNLTTCTECFDRSFALLPSGQCQLCSVTRPYCSKCMNTTRCVDCQWGWAAYTDGNCYPQGPQQSGIKCFSFPFYNHSYHYDCSQCGVGTAINYYWGSLRNCPPCGGQCVYCTNINFCIQCLPGYPRTPNGAICQKCNVTMPRCLNCTTTLNCIKCQQTISLLSNGSCPLCSTLMPDCIQCANHLSPICTKCVSNYFAISFNLSACQLCSSLMPQCITCDDNSVCTSCNLGFTVYKQLCFQCHYFMDNCTECSDPSTCLACQVGYTLNNMSQCIKCDTNIAKCKTCSSPTVCLTCGPSYALVNNTCVTCSLAHRKCRECDNLTTCIQCLPYWFLQNGSCFYCRLQHKLCSTCDDSVKCNQCLMNAVLDSSFKCKCKKNYYEVNNLCIDDPFCISAIQKGQKVECKYCDYYKHSILGPLGKCICRQLYTLVNGSCVQKCGDGILLTLPCDDGNLINNDGCSSTCQQQTDFVCYNEIYYTSICKLALQIQFKLYYTQKILSQNKAIMYLIIDSINPNIIKYLKADYFSMSLFTDRDKSLEIKKYYRNQKYMIVLEIDYTQTIQDSQMNLYYTFSQQKVLQLHEKLTVKLNGINYPLIVSSYTQHYGLIYKIQQYLMMVYYCLLLLMLISDKFIAVECLTTIQLIYFSQILINKNKNYVQSFITLLPLKYSNGLNYLIPQQYTYQNVINTKFSEYCYLLIGESFIINNLFNIGLLIFIFIIFVILYLIKNPKQRSIQKMKDSIQQTKRITKQIETIRPWLKKIYSILFNLSYVMLAYVIVSLFVQSSFLRDGQSSFVINLLDKIFSLIFFGLVIIIISQTFWHFFLSLRDLINQRYQVKLRDIFYKKIFLLNFLVNIIFIILINNKLILTLPLSVYLFCLGLLYLLFIYLYNPYGYTFRIHRYTILINQVLYLIVLGVMTIINFEAELKQEFFVIFAYFMMFSISFIVVLAVVRCYLWFRYGEEQIKKQILKQINLHKNRPKRYLKQQQQQYNIKNYKRNKYIYSNQYLKDQQINYLNQLKHQRNFLTDYQKDILYYKFYENKPLDWLVQNEENEDMKEMIQREILKEQKYEQKRKRYFDQRKQKVSAGKHSSKMLIRDPQQQQMTLQQIKNNLRKQFKIKIRNGQIKRT